MKRCFWIGGLLLVLSGVVGIYARPVHHTTFGQSERALPTQSVEATSFTVEERFIGTVQAIQSVAIVPYLSGYLQEILVAPGTQVHQGQPLFILDRRIPSANLAQAQEAALQAEADRTNAETYYERMKNTESKAISSTDLEQAGTAFQAADAVYQKALAAQNQAQTLYDYTTLTAPIDGWVGNITATVGAYLSPEGETLATIIGFSPVRVVFSVPMSAYRSAEDFDGAILQLTLSNGKTIEIKDFRVRQDNRADKATDSLLFFTDVANPTHDLVPNAYVEVRFLYSETGILVPKNQVTLTPTGAEVFVSDNGIIQKRAVEIGAPVGNQYWIKSGLSPGDKLVTAPVSTEQVGHTVGEVKP